MRKFLLLLVTLIVGLAGQKASAYTVRFNLDEGVDDVLDANSSWNYSWSYSVYGTPLISNADETVSLRIQCKRGYSVSSVEVDGAAISGDVVDGEYCVSFTMHAYDMMVRVTTGGVSTWAALNEAFANASTDADAPTEVVLVGDITAVDGDTFFTLSNSHHLRLDLNGHTINRNMSAPAADGYVIAAKQYSSLTILDSSTEQTGTITGGWGSANVGCISAINATLRLEGGTITGNRVNYQGGSAVYFSGNFYMTDGTITGNIANAGNPNSSNYTSCGAVYFSNDGNFYMSGGSITGNYCGTTTMGSAGIGFYLGMGTKSLHLTGRCNISGNLQGTYDEATGTWSDLQPNDYLNTNRCHIHLDDAIETTAPMVMVLCSIYGYYADFTRGWSTYMDGKDPEDYFTLLPYVTDRGIGVVNGEATISTLHTITLGENITANYTSAVQGRRVTLGYNNLPEGYQVAYTVTIDGTDPAETVEVTDSTFTMPDGDVTVAATLSLPIDQAHFPDANFRNYLLSQSYGSDAVITIEEIAGITSIYVAYKSIADLTGIEYFTALRQLSCNSNQLTALNVSHNTALTSLDCCYNQLTSLDVSNNTVLTRLQCYSNQLTALDVSQNTALETFDCNTNQLTSLDVSHNTALEYLLCYSNQLTALDVSQNTALTSLQCNSNQLTSLDVSHNTALTHLVCYNNQIYSDNMAALVASLPTVSQNGRFYVVDLDSDDEQNVITPTQVATARGKNWTVYGLINGDWQEYDGSPEGIPIIAAYFPDANFRNYLRGEDYGSDRVLTDEEIADITLLSVGSQNIADLTGIEHFTALEWLYCQNNQLTALDVSHNTALKTLNCNINQLQTLDVSQNTALTRLQCYDNQLTALDVSNNTDLTTLMCSNNQLTALDVSNNTALTSLQCSDNQLTTLDVSHNTELTSLQCDNNQLGTLDVSLNTALKKLYCNHNQLTALDLSNNTALTDLYCKDNQLTALDLSLNTALKWLYCNNNQLTTLDLSHNTALTLLYCDNNQIYGENMTALVASLPTVAVGYGDFDVVDLDSSTEQNVITPTQVATARGKNWTVYCLIDGNWRDYDGYQEGLPIDEAHFPDANFRNYLLALPYGWDHILSDEEIAGITSLDVSGDSIADLTGIEHFTALTRLDCNGNQLTALDVSQNTALTSLQCNSNQLSSLDVSLNTALTTLWCNSNQLTALDLSQNTALTSLQCNSNQLQTLNVSHNTALEYLQCYNNQLQTLDVSNNTALTTLQCHNNQLQTLDVSNNTALTELYCRFNELTLLDVSHNTELTLLWCNNNQLTALDVSLNTALTSLNCGSNQLSSLDVSLNTALGYLRCDNNQINGENMEALVASLPTVAVGNGEFRVIDFDSSTEQNFITATQVATARGKNWRAYGLANGNWHEYDGYQEGLPIDEAHFPDANFRNYLLAQSYGWDHVLSDEEIAGIISLNVPGDSIADLTGIEHFTALQQLYCYSNQLTALDVSHNTALTNLDCSNNQLTSLDVSNNTALQQLYCYSNQLTALDVSQNTALQHLYCNSNQLTALDVSNNTDLRELYCHNNRINGRNMAALVASLPTVNVNTNFGRNGEFRVIDLDSNTEQNVITTTQVATARGKNWTVKGYTDENGWQEYDGSEPPIEVSYIDENRETQSQEAIALTGNETSLGVAGGERWYVASGTLNYTQTLTLSGDVHLILANGAVMNIGTANDPVSDYGINGDATECALTIYGQTLDDATAGHLNIYSNGECMLLWGYYAQHGGNVTLNSSNDNCLCLYYDVTFTGGTLNATADKNAIYNSGNIDILGGKLSAVCVGSYWGINTYGNLTFGWKDADDEITFSNLNKGGNYDVMIVEGQAFTDGENIYYSTTAPEVLWALGNVTLRPVIPCAINLPSEFEHGTVECDKATAVVGETVTLTVTPDEGYELDVLTVTIVDDEPNGAPALKRGGTVTLTPGGDGTFTFEMPDAPVTVNATFRETTGVGLIDIDGNDANGRRYNVLGQPVDKNYRGIVIVNGKKVVKDK